MADLEVQQIPLSRPLPYQPQAKALKEPVTRPLDQPPRNTRHAEPSKERMSDDSFIGKLDDIGTMLRKNVVSQRGGNEAGLGKVDKTYRDFMKMAEGQRHVMEHASDEQKDAFREMVEEMVKMRKDGKIDTDKAYAQMKRVVSTLNEKDGPEHVKNHLEKIASTAMKNLDKDRMPGGLAGVAIKSAHKFFTADAKDEANPLFRYLAGMDKPKDPSKMVTALEEAQNEGKSEKLKTQLGLDITGEGGGEGGIPNPMEKMLDQMVAKLKIVINGQGGNGTGGGNGSVKFPEKVENLHVENLIIKNVQRQQERDVTGAQGDKKLLSYEVKGKSALALPAPSTPSSGTDVAKVEPKMIGHDKSTALATIGSDVIEQKPSSELGHPELRTYHVPTQKKLGMSGHKGAMSKAIGHSDIEYTDFKEVPKAEPKQIAYKEVPKKAESSVKYPPISQKRQNKLKTDETPMAKAVRGALADVKAPAIQQKPTVIDALTGSPLAMASIMPKDSDFTPDAEAPEAVAAESGGDSSLLDTAKDVLDDLPSRDKGKGKPKAPKPAKPAGKWDKLAKTGGKLIKGAAVAGAVVDVGMGVNDLLDGKAQEELPSGLDMLSPMRWGMYAGDKINKGIEKVSGGQSLGSMAYDWMNPEPKKLPPEIQMRPNDSGTKLNALNAENASIKSAPAQAPAPVVINSGSQAAPAPSVTTIMPVGASPRNRESYFDRMQMNTIVK